MIIVAIVASRGSGDVVATGGVPVATTVSHETPAPVSRYTVTVVPASADPPTRTLPSFVGVADSAVFAGSM